ncbi:cytochrome c oxidase subunit 7A1, mitochondrial [Drosophila sechellia]|uniref:cytochrome c oxidase subunit 7A1, mitochondrial n=1 Tax=Drosophila sechellia TaxID=7238 RepID=UPI0013DDB1BB|nr:cytochrome c oxidase subunit 7A1, mitochondrial [Drosophila sechellia]XP_032581213.1 cytochrome c oxidase subunit 7A1, mitochondrial [Drosophila sechellia]XP_032581220.1 cytochrome c oxidase subunit 7A1, mitochondrial [Drosophila sechellia]
MALPDGLSNKMKVFQAVNEVPVFLKGGPADKILFGITAGLCGLGIVSFVHLVYTMGFAKKKA